MNNRFFTNQRPVNHTTVNNTRILASQRPINNTVDTGAKRFANWVADGCKPTKKSRRKQRKKELNAALRKEEKARERDHYYDKKQTLKKGILVGGALLYVFTYLAKPLLEECIEHLENNHNTACVDSVLPNGLPQNAINQTFFDNLNDTLDSKFNDTLEIYGDLNLSARQRKTIFNSAYENASHVFDGVKNMTGSVKRTFYREFKDELNSSFGLESKTAPHVAEQSSANTSTQEIGSMYSDSVDSGLTRGSLEDCLPDPVQIINKVYGGQHNPDICGNKIVWSDDRGGWYNTDIYMYDLGPDGEHGTIVFNLETGGEYTIGDDIGEIQITQMYGKQEHPAIHGNKIVWENYNGSRDHHYIYMYDLGPDGEFGTGDDGGEVRIRSDIGIHPEDQYNPNIYGNKIVWEDCRNSRGDIYMYDLGPDYEYGTDDDIGEVRITNDDETIFQLGKMNPKIYENKIVWQDYRNRTWSIYMYDLGSDGIHGTMDDGGEVRMIDDGYGSQWRPDIYGNKIVWGNHGDIYMYDLGLDGKFGTGDDSEVQITDDAEFPQYGPKIYGNKIVWGNHGDIYMYDLGLDGIFGTEDDVGKVRITDGTADPKNPNIYGNKIVWEEWKEYGRNNPYVYMIDISKIKNEQQTSNNKLCNEKVYIAIGIGCGLGISSGFVAGKLFLWKKRKTKAEQGDYRPNKRDCVTSQYSTRKNIKQIPAPQMKELNKDVIWDDDLDIEHYTKPKERS